MHLPPDELSLGHSRSDIQELWNEDFCFKFIKPSNIIPALAQRKDRTKVEGILREQISVIESSWSGSLFEFSIWGRKWSVYVTDKDWPDLSALICAHSIPGVSLRLRSWTGESQILSLVMCFMVFPGFIEAISGFMTAWPSVYPKAPWICG